MRDIKNKVARNFVKQTSVLFKAFLKVIILHEVSATESINSISKYTEQ